MLLDKNQAATSGIGCDLVFVNMSEKVSQKEISTTLLMSVSTGQEDCYGQDDYIFYVVSVLFDFNGKFS